MIHLSKIKSALGLGITAAALLALTGPIKAEGRLKNFQTAFGFYASYQQCVKRRFTSSPALSTR